MSQLLKLDVWIKAKTLSNLSIEYQRIELLKSLQIMSAFFISNLIRKIHKKDRWKIYTLEKSRNLSYHWQKEINQESRNKTCTFTCNHLTWKKLFDLINSLNLVENDSSSEKSIDLYEKQIKKRASVD